MRSAVALLLRAALVCGTIAGATPAQVRHPLDARARVNLDAIARRDASRSSRLRAIPRPQASRRKSARAALQPGAIRPAIAETDAPYPLYSGFPAIMDTYRAAPPDTGGAVGPNDVVTMLNAQMQIQSRTGEVRANYPIDLNRFWSGLGEFSSTFDPRIQYDSEGGRWIAAAGVNPGQKTAALLIGVSETSDPGGDWNMYLIDIGAGGCWADYPVLGFNRNWVVLSANIFRLPPAGAYDRTDIYVFNKSYLYRNGGGQYLTFSDDQGEFSAVRDYDNSHPDVFYFVQVSVAEAGRIRISMLEQPGTERFTAGAGEIIVPDAWAEAAPNDADFAPQLGSWAKVYTGDSRLQNCVMRHEAIWCAHTVFLPTAKPDRTAVQWFQIDPAAYRLADTGRIDDPTANTFYAFPSIAANRNDEVLIGYTRFSKSGYPDAAFSLRSISNSGDFTWRRTAFKRGEAPYIAIGFDAGNRWGDFSGTLVDPVDDVRFWTIQEYASTPTQGYLGRWGTWWAQIVPPSAGMNCSYSLSAAELSFDSAGGAGSVAVETGTGCPWMATSDSGWLAIQSGASGTGSATVNFTVAPKRSAGTLAGSITIAGQIVSVSQR